MFDVYFNRNLLSPKQQRCFEADNEITSKSESNARLIRASQPKRFVIFSLQQRIGFEDTVLVRCLLSSNNETTL